MSEEMVKELESELNKKNGYDPEEYKQCPFTNCKCNVVGRGLCTGCAQIK